MNKKIFGGRGAMWAFGARFSEEKIKSKYSDKIDLGTYELVKCKLKQEIQFGLDVYIRFCERNLPTHSTHTQ